MTVYFLLTIPVHRGKRHTVQGYAHFERIETETETDITFIDETGHKYTMKKADILTIETDDKEGK